MANFVFCCYHFVQLDEPDLFSKAEEGVADFDECYNPRFIEGVAMNAEGIGEQTSLTIIKQMSSPFDQTPNFVTFVYSIEQYEILNYYQLYGCHVPRKSME